MVSDNLHDIERISMDDKMDDEVNNLLQHIEMNQLQTFTAQYAYKHASFEKDILEHSNPKKPAKSLAE